MEAHFQFDSTLRPESSQDCRAYTDAEDNLKFYPPLYMQRYEVVWAILGDERWAGNIQTVVEFGCAELAMFKRLKSLPNVTKIVMVDIDPDVLEFYACRAAPLNSDFLSPRKKPLHVDVLCGSVADCDSRTAGADAVICIELIEHLYEDVLQKLQFTIFGFIKPKIAIFTTPNSDFNVLLKGLGTKFRHPDHKFEWSREEFKIWCDNIVSQYPDYKVEIRGVGLPPLGKEHVGCCSQLALFIQSDHAEGSYDIGREKIYKVFKTYDHPVFSDDRTVADKIRNEVQYLVHSWSGFKIYTDDDDGLAYIPLCDIVDAMQNKFSGVEIDIHLVRKILESKCIDCDVVTKDNVLMAVYDRSPPSCQFMEDYELYDDVANVEEEDQHQHVDKMDEKDEEELWAEIGPPIYVEPMALEQIQRDIEDLSWAQTENEVNLMRERELMLGESDESYDSDSDSDNYYWTPGYVDDCEKRWNHTAERPPFMSHWNWPNPNSDGGNTSHSDAGELSQSDGVSKSFSTVGNSSGSSAACGGNNTTSTENLKDSGITSLLASCGLVDSGVEMSPLKSKQSHSNDEFDDSHLSMLCSNSHLSNLPVSKDIPKSTSVEVLHLDGLPCVKRSAGLECVEFSPSSSVTLCYTGETYHHSKKDTTSNEQPFSPDLKSLDGSLQQDVSLDIDQAGDSGYPNSSSLHHDVDVDLTPEQVDDISSENGDNSNESISEDESDISDSAPAVRRIIVPRRPFVPMMFENVENGDLANNNRDGEGNNAVPALGGDERVFVAMVEEGQMLPLMAAPAPIQEDVILPNDADPYPYWLSNLLGIDDLAQREEESAIFSCPNQKHFLNTHRQSICDSDDEGLGDDSCFTAQGLVPR